MHQHPSDWHNNTGIIRQAEEQGMGIILMRPLTSGVFQRLMAEAFPEIDVLDVGRLLLNYVLSDPYVDVALVQGHASCPRETRFAEVPGTGTPRSQTTSRPGSTWQGCTIHMRVEEGVASSHRTICLDELPGLCDPSVSNAER